MLINISYRVYAIEDEVYNYVYKNILCYAIRYSSALNSYYNASGFIDSQSCSKEFVKDLIPDYGYKLFLKFDTIDSIQYPLKNYTLIAIDKDKYGIMYEKKYEKVSILRKIFYDYFPYNRYYLIAYDTIKHDIKYISGAFYLTRISDDFKFNDVQDYINYIKLKTFRYKITDLIFEKQSRKCISFRGFSTYLQKYVRITLYFKDLDIVDIVVF